MLSCMWNGESKRFQAANGKNSLFFDGPSKLHQTSFIEMCTYFFFGFILWDIPNSTTVTLHTSWGSTLPNAPPLDFKSMRLSPILFSLTTCQQPRPLLQITSMLPIVGHVLNTLPPATDSGRTARTPLYPPVQVVPPLLPPLFFLSQTEEPVRHVPMTGVCYNSLL